MARLPPLAYMNDPEEEERRARLLEQEYGPPPPLPNLGVMSRDAVQQADRLARGGITTADIEAAAARGEQPWPETPAMRARLDQLAQQDEELAPESALDGLLRLPAPVATNPYEDEPDPETVAADTADERETPPSGEEESASISPPKLSLGFNPLEELERVRDLGSRDWRNTSYQTLNKGGPNPDLMGYEHPASAREAASARAGELYGEATPSARWEDDFLANHDRLSDAQIRRRSAVMTFFGRPEVGDKFRESERRHASDYDDQLAEARERDRGEQRISKGLAQAIAGANLGVSPEEAVQLRMNDPVVKSFTNGGYSQGLRGEGQQISITKKVWDIMAKLGIEGAQHQNDIEKLLLRGATELQVAELYATKGKGAPDPAAPGFVADATPEEIAITLTARRLSISEPEARKVWGGDLSGLTPEQARNFGIMKPENQRAANDPVLARQILSDLGKTEAGRDLRLDILKEHTRAKDQNDLTYKEAWQKKWRAAELPLKEAMQAWGSMSQAGKEAMAKWSSQGFAGTIPAVLRESEDGPKAAAVQSVINELVHARAGSAVTGSEWDRIALEVGLPTGTWAPFNSTKSIENWLQRSANAMIKHREDYESILGGWEGAQ